MYIEKIKGKYLQSLPSGAIVDVNGMGYGVELPLSAICSLPVVGEDVSFWTYTYVREDQIKLFGFPTYAERYCFEILLSLNGVGPKVALAVMSTMTIASIVQAIRQENSATFALTPGVGKRLSEKILLELKPKLAKLAACLDDDGAPLQKIFSGKVEGSAVVEDVRSALENFGYREADINSAMKTLLQDQRPMEFGELMRRALMELNAVLPKHSGQKVSPETDLF